MKKYITFIGVLITIIVILLFIEYFPFGVKNYKIKNGNIKVPRMVFKSKEKNNELVFETFRSSKALKKEINNILSEYHVMKVNKKDYYYDMKQNITITKYEVKSGFITSKIIIKYE